MARITHTFKRLKTNECGGFIPFITAGDPDLKTSEDLIVALARCGADIIEVGVPFSDPVADGIVIQRASERALKNGVSVSDVLACIEAAQKRTSVPVVLFSYFNPLLQYGVEPLARDAKRAGVDGILVTDLIPEEAETWSAALGEHELDPIYLVAPTTSDARLKLIANAARGFIYAVSRAGVTGARERMTNDAEGLVNRVRGVTDLPVAVGFGISTAAQVRDVWRYADAAVVGSAIVKEVEVRAGDDDLVRRVSAFAGGLLADE